MNSQLWKSFYGVLGGACILGWVALFVAGHIHTDTSALRAALATNFDLVSFTQFCIYYTPTNAALLTCLMGLAGGSLRNMSDDRSHPFGSFIRRENPFASMLRSFVMYLLFVAGIAASSSENPFAAPKPDQYLRFAGLISALGFTVGYDPEVLKEWLKRVTQHGGKQPPST